MSGYHSRFDSDPNYIESQEELSSRQNNYVMYHPAVMRGDNNHKVPFLTQASNIDFYGPLTSKRIHQESFLQGRGHTLSKSPGNQVTYLPESVFQKNLGLARDPKDRIDMLPLFTRVKPTCNGMRESDTSVFSLFPGKWQGDYSGVNSVNSTLLQTRMGPNYNPYRNLQGATNYGSYAPTRSYAPYT